MYLSTQWQCNNHTLASPFALQLHAFAALSLLLYCEQIQVCYVQSTSDARGSSFLKTTLLVFIVSLMTGYFVLIESPRGIDSTRKCRAKPFQYQRHQPSSQLVLFGQNHHEYLVLARACTRNDHFPYCYTKGRLPRYLHSRDTIS